MKIPRDLAVETSYRLDDILSVVLEKVLEDYGDDDPDKSGICRIYYAVDPTNGIEGWHELRGARVGEREEYRWEAIGNYSQEKTHRLMKLFAHDNRIVSSRQSRRPNFWEYGGAIILSANIPDLGGLVLILISFSGLSEQADETFGMLLAKKMGWCNGFGQFEKLVGYSGNGRALKLLHAA